MTDQSGTTLPKLNFWTVTAKELSSLLSGMEWSMMSKALERSRASRMARDLPPRTYRWRPSRAPSLLNEASCMQIEEGRSTTCDANLAKYRRSSTLLKWWRLSLISVCRWLSQWCGEDFAVLHQKSDRNQVYRWRFGTTIQQSYGKFKRWTNRYSILSLVTSKCCVLLLPVCSQYSQRISRGLRVWSHELLKHRKLAEATMVTVGWEYRDAIGWRTSHGVRWSLGDNDDLMVKVLQLASHISKR